MKCKIVLKDEINCKIEGLELTTRRTLEKKLKFLLPYAFHSPAYKLGRWDGCVSFFSTGGNTFINCLPYIIPVLDAARYQIEIEDNRYRWDLSFPQITEDYFSHKVWPAKHPAAGEPVVLRDYQVDIINQFLANPQSLQEIATGAGKTLITAALSNLVEMSIDTDTKVQQKLITGKSGARSIVIVPNKDLVIQTEADYINLGLDVGVYFGDRKDLNKTHTICTWQSLNVIDKRFKDGESEYSLADFSQGVVCLIVDECFDGDTLVLTPTGKKFIKELKAGDKVINLCERTQQYKEDTVVKVHRNLTHTASEPMLELEFDNGLTTKVTANHKFLTNKGWVRADELTEDLEIIDINTYN